VVAFALNCGGPPPACRAPVLEAAWAWGWGGPLVACSAEAARTALSAASPTRVALYSPLPDWCLTPAPHSDWAALYRHPRLALAAPTPALAAALTRAWGRPSTVAPPGDGRALLSLFESAS
jgi:hypothetical protein